MADHEQEYADQARRYRLDERIASGGMGHVWRGTDTVLDRPVAIKLLKHEYADDAVFRSRFETEAQHAAGLRHPGVAQVFDFGGTHGGTHSGRHGDTHGGTPYLVMEYVDGRPLSSLLRAGRPMDPEAAAALLAAAGDAIGAAHAQGIVHRDVKPANLLVTDDRRVKITDFGIARAADAVALTRVGEVLGTPQYLSPEQAEGRTATPASDVYSLGVVGFECLAGRRPFVADSPIATALAHLHEPVPELPDGVPPALAAVVRRALAKDPADRYPDGSAFAQAVRTATAAPAAAVPAPTMVLTSPVPVATAAVDPAAGPAAGTSPLTRARSGAEVWRERARRVPVPIWAAAGAFLVVVAVAAFASTDSGGGQAPGGSTSTTRVSATGSTTGPAAPAGSTATTPSTRVTTATTPTTTPSTPTGSATKPAPPGHGHHKPPKHHGHQGKGHQ